MAVFDLNGSPQVPAASLLLDAMLPGKDGFEICPEDRKNSDIPIIMLTARGEIIDHLSGLWLGADHCDGALFECRIPAGLNISS